MAGREILERDLDFAGNKGFGPAAPVNPTDLVRLQDLNAAIAGVGSVPSFASGVTLSGGVVRGDYITGKAGNQTWTGGTAAGDTLTIRASSDSAPGALTLTGGQVTLNATPPVIASAPSVNWDAINMPGATVVLSGSTLISNVLGFNYVTIKAPGIFTSGSATITHAATLAIASSPTGGVPITNAYALWVQAGVTYLAGSVKIQSLSGLLKATGGIVGVGSSGIDYEVPLTFHQGVTRTVNDITADYITGIAIGGGGQTVWTGGTGAGEGLILRTTSNGTKGTLTVGNLFFKENLGRLGLGGQNNPQRVLHVLDSGDVQIRFGQDSGGLGDYEIGRKSADGLCYLTSTHPSVAGFVVGGGGGERLRVDSSGAVTIAGLGGGTAAMVKASTAGTLQRATAGTDYQAPLSAADSTISFPTTTTIKVGTLPQKFIVQGTADSTLSGAQFLGNLSTGLLKSTTTTGVVSIASAGVDYEPALTFTSGLSRSGNTITGDYITGKALGGGNTTWVGGTGSGEGIVLSTTTNATKGSLTIGTTVYKEATNRLGINQSSPQQRLHVTDAGNVQVRVGQATGSEYDLGRNSSDGLFYVSSTHATVAGLVVTGTTGDRFRVDTTGNATVSGLAGTGSALINASSAGLLGRATAGTDYEPALNFSTGLTRVSNTITANLSTGVAGSQTAAGGNSATASANLTLASTLNATKGKILFGLSSYDDSTADTLSLLSANTTFSTPTLVLASNNVSGQAVFHLRTSTSTLRAGIRADAGGNLVDFSTGGYRMFLVGGDFSTGRVAAKFFNNGNFLVNGTSVGVDPSDLGALVGAGGTAQQLGITRWAATPATTAASTSLAWNAHLWDTVTATLTSAVNVTTAAGFNFAVFRAPTLTNASSMQITNAATVMIENQPANAGSLTIANAMALWVAGGLSRFDSTVNMRSTVVIQSLNGMLKAVSGTVFVASGGTDYELPLTFSTGLSRSINTITAMISTGKSGGQTAFGGTANGENLTLKSTTTGNGVIKLGNSFYDDSSADTMTFLSGNTSFSTPTLILSSSSATGQAVMHFRTSTSTTRAGLRGESGGNFYDFSNGGYRAFLTGGDFGTGIVRAKIFANGNFLVANTSAGVDPTDIGSRLGVSGVATGNTAFHVTGGTSLLDGTLGVGGATPTAGNQVRIGGNVSVDASSTNPLDYFLLDNATVSVSGTNNINSLGFNYATFKRPTLSGSLTISQAATVAIEGPPAASGVTITNPWAFWVQSGFSKFGSLVQIQGGTLVGANHILSIPPSVFSPSVAMPSSFQYAMRVFPQGISLDVFYYVPIIGISQSAFSG